MPLDARWLEILKASGWKTTALAVASALLVYGNSKEWFPTPFEPWKIQIAVVTLVVCSCLSLASVGSAIKPKLARMWAIRREKHEVTKAIPQMTTKERQIVSYLLVRNQRMFTSTPDGGYANTLISKGTVVCALLPGQSRTYLDTPFEVPKHVWDVLIKHKAEFPYVPPEAGESEPHPWRVRWTLR